MCRRSKNKFRMEPHVCTDAATAPPRPVPARPFDVDKLKSLRGLASSA